MLNIMQQVFKWYFITLIIFLSGDFAKAEIIKYVDKEGVQHYVTDPSKVPEEYKSAIEKDLKLPSIGKTKILNFSETLQAESSYLHPSGRVLLFVREGCGFCVLTEQLLKKKRVNYRRIDLGKDSQGRKIYEKLNVSGVPVLMVGKKVIEGYNEKAILAAVHRK